jgi:hypothetical protein
MMNPGPRIVKKPNGTTSQAELFGFTSSGESDAESDEVITLH